jgi:phosphatidylinositol alpha-1,6-mannosyltransferase
MPNRQIDEDIEGFGIVFLEAGAAGKPVIGGLSGGTADAIQDGITGLRVDGENTQAITDAVVALAKNIQAAKAMGEQGRLRVEADFSWDLVVQRTRQIIANIAETLC